MKDDSQDKKDKSDHNENGSDEEGKYSTLDHPFFYTLVYSNSVCSYLSGLEEEKKSTHTKSTKSILDKKKDSTINVDEQKETLEGNSLVKKGTRSI